MSFDPSSSVGWSVAVLLFCSMKGTWGKAVLPTGLGGGLEWPVAPSAGGSAVVFCTGTSLGLGEGLGRLNFGSLSSNGRSTTGRFGSDCCCSVIDDVLGGSGFLAAAIGLSFSLSSCWPFVLASEVLSSLKAESTLLCVIFETSLSNSDFSSCDVVDLLSSPLAPEVFFFCSCPAHGGGVTSSLFLCCLFSSKSFMDSIALPDRLLACCIISLILMPPPPSESFFGGGVGFTFSFCSFGGLEVFKVVVGALCGIAGGRDGALDTLGMVLAKVVWGPGLGISEGGSGRSSYKSSWGALLSGNSSYNSDIFYCRIKWELALKGASYSGGDAGHSLPSPFGHWRMDPGQNGKR